MQKSARRFTALAFGLALLLSPLRGMAATAKLLVKNARILTMAPGKKQTFIGYMLVAEDGTIEAVAAGDPPADAAASEVWDARGHWVMPGFISAHSHLWQAAYRGLAADKTLPGWIDDLYGQRAVKASPEDYYWFCLEGALDHLERGVTSAYNFNYGGTSWNNPAMHKGSIDFDKYQFHAETDSGIRFVHGYQVDAMKPGAPPGPAIEDARIRLKSFLDFVAAQPKSSKYLSTMLNGGTAFNNTYQQAVMEATLMKEFGLGNQSHYLEPPDTIGEEQSKFRWFMDSGLLSPQLIFGHFIHTNDFILQQSARAGAADIPRYLKDGIRVGMGVDGEASADLADPFENMRTGLYAIRDKYEDATIMSPYQVLYLHTMGSADVLGVKDRLGSLEPGKYADFLVIDPTDFGPVFDVYASLVLVGSQRELERVYVGGELLVDHGRLLKQDRRKVQAEVDRRVQASAQVLLPALAP
jgi:5-methylthioadenosine/S-adenosylhomocysteine deaminase